MAELAANASQSRSRLSHTCSRLESKGLVMRDTCPGDKRGVFAILTPRATRRSNGPPATTSRRSARTSSTSSTRRTSRPSAAPSPPS
ncbi:MarR family winged helix-turn-helix transcriptional regulator [Actinomadura sp. J1-007]|uniref:MarR family winged helix-turn-helix transcriptional regulator n=1 Tax=Actinomadura sp. J1-007 TaxID=2661913 RepID=UPI001F4F506D|nr:hypothetical protein [Actinomadura sp. J1-007]